MLGCSSTLALTRDGQPARGCADAAWRRRVGNAARRTARCPQETDVKRVCRACGTGGAAGDVPDWGGSRAAAADGGGRLCLAARGRLPSAHPGRAYPQRTGNRHGRFRPARRRSLCGPGATRDRGNGRAALPRLSSHAQRTGNRSRKCGDARIGIGRVGGSGARRDGAKFRTASAAVGRGQNALRRRCRLQDGAGPEPATWAHHAAVAWTRRWLRPALACTPAKQPVLACKSRCRRDRTALSGRTTIDAMVRWYHAPTQESARRLS